MDAHSLECLDFPRVRELLAGFAMTGLGKSLALSVRPITRETLIRRWLVQVDELDRIEPELGLPPMAGISDVREVVKNCAPPLHISVDDIARVGDTLRGTHSVSGYLRRTPENCSELRHLAERIGDFSTIAERIRRVVDERAKVRDDASPKLHRIRREIDQVTSETRTAVDRLLHDASIRRLLQYPNHTFHNDRMVLPVRTEYRGRLPGIVHRSSDSGATIYVEPAIAVELNNRIANLRSEEQEEINRLLWELSHEVYVNSQEILKTLETLAVLDLIIAKLRFARAFELRCPQLNDDGRVAVRQARHPLLLDLQRRRRLAGEPTDEIVPIDYRLGEDFNMLVITGPNTGGKTVTLKTVGLLCLMVQAGLPVPVGPGSAFGIFHDVLIDVGDEQSMAQSLSTFSAHLTRQLDMLKRAGPRTLVLIDELGAGTDPDEGAAIGRSLLDELMQRDARCMTTTHLGALKGYALVRDRVENACVEFDIATLRPTYHLRIGESGQSNAIDIAQRLGMPRRLVIMARRNLSRKARALNTALKETATVKRAAEDARAAAENAKHEAHKALGEAGLVKARLEQQHAEYSLWVQRVVHLQPGDAVRVRGFDRDGKIIRVRLDQQRAEVDAGAFAVEVPLGDVLPPETPPPPPPAPRPQRPQVDHAPANKRGPHRGQVGRPEGQQQRGGESHHGGHPRPGGPRPDQRPRPEEKPRPMVPSLTDEQAAALKPGDRVLAKRFHREGTIVRLKLNKKIAVVTVGVLEVELPFDGLAAPYVHEAPRPKRPPAPRPVAAQPSIPAAVADVPDEAAAPTGADVPPAAGPQE